MRVLVVEQDPALRHMADRVLTRRAHHVIVAATVFDAIALLLDFPDPPDIVVLDLDLPGMGGLTYAERLRDQYPGVRCVFVVNDGVNSAAPAGATLLRKPFTPDALIATIEINA
jgi:DNA-binding response OmpR family regulator